MKLNKIQLSTADKEILETIANRKILLRNTSEKNQAEIGSLQTLGIQNALVYLQRNKLGQKLSLLEENNLFVTVKNLADQLGLQNLPRRIECYDISHISGKFVYGSMVVFIDGKPAKKLYRLFRCKDQNNDFENHKQVLTRRFNRLLADLEANKTESDWELPDLIIVDGGKGQLSVDLQVVSEFAEIFTQKGYNFKTELCALAKKQEEVFLPNTPESIILQGQAIFLIQRIRDEAHRFAITNNRKARLKEANKSDLDNITGVGPKTKQKLLTVFHSVPNLILQLEENRELIIELVGKSATKKLLDYYNIRSSK